MAEVAQALADLGRTLRINLGPLIIKVNEGIPATKTIPPALLLETVIPIVLENAVDVSFRTISKRVADKIKLIGRARQVRITDAASVQQRLLEGAQQRFTQDTAILQRLNTEISQITQQIQELTASINKHILARTQHPTRAPVHQRQIDESQRLLRSIEESYDQKIAERAGAVRRIAKATQDKTRLSSAPQEEFDLDIINLLATLIALNTEIILEWKANASEAVNDDEKTRIDEIFDELLTENIELTRAFTGNLQKLDSKFIIDQYVANTRSFLARSNGVQYTDTLVEIIKNTVGDNFGISPPHDLKDLRIILVCGKTNTYEGNAKRQEGILKFKEQEKHMRLRADNIDDLKQFNASTLEGMNAYAYFKLCVYAPAEAWEEVSWMTNLKDRAHDHWYENPVLRFDIFLNAWIIDTLSRVKSLNATKSISELKAIWRRHVSPHGGTVARDKIIVINEALLTEIQNFDAFFNINYQSIFPRLLRPDGRPEQKINPFHILINRDFIEEFAQEHFFEGIMIDCARSALNNYLLESRAVIANSLERYDGTPIVPNTRIQSVNRIQIRGMKFFIQFIDSKILSMNLERTSADLFAYISIHKKFLEYVNTFVFMDDIRTQHPETSLIGGFRGLLVYLQELRRRVDSGEEIVDSSPNIYVDVPIIEIEDIDGFGPCFTLDSSSAPQLQSQLQSPQLQPPQSQSPQLQPQLQPPQSQSPQLQPQSPQLQPPPANASTPLLPHSGIGARSIAGTDPRVSVSKGSSARTRQTFNPSSERGLRGAQPSVKEDNRSWILSLIPWLRDLRKPKSEQEKLVQTQSIHQVSTQIPIAKLNAEMSDDEVRPTLEAIEAYLRSIA